MVSRRKSRAPRAKPAGRRETLAETFSGGPGAQDGKIRLRQLAAGEEKISNYCQSDNRGKTKN